MSRIHDALSRAGSEPAAATVAPDDEVFVSPWADGHHAAPPPPPRPPTVGGDDTPVGRRPRIDSARIESSRMDSKVLSDLAPARTGAPSSPEPAQFARAD